MKLKILIFYLFVQCYGQSLKFGDLAKSAFDTTLGVAKKIPDSIPSPEDFFEIGKNVIAGYPFEVVFAAINEFCSAALSAKNIKPKVSPNLDEMNFILKTKTEDYLVPLNDAEKLWKHPAFNRSLNTVIVVTGWTTNFNESENEPLILIYDAYKCRGGVNFIAIDTAKFVDTLYSWSAFNTEDIGQLVARGLSKLITNYPIENIHLIGHSLGAHICGSIGRNLNYLTEKLLPRITGLDPANPCFNEGEQLSGLSRGDAEFIDVIHSNCGALGKRDPIGDVDFYPNGLDPLPPGCLTVICAHARSWEFYAESVLPGNEKTFLGVQCGSLAGLKSGYCPGRKFPMGYAVPINLKGSYFLETKGNSPFGEIGTARGNIKCNE